MGGGDTHMHQPPSAAVSSGTESARFSKRWSLLCVCVCVCVCVRATSAKEI